MIRIRATTLVIFAVSAAIAIGSVAAITCARRSPAVSSTRDTIGDSDVPEWLQLFNGRDLEDWVPKFAGHEVGVNLNHTFRAENRLLKVRYDSWTEFNGEFGHLFYKRQPFSYYVVAVEYRFVGEQVRGAGPHLAWAIRNNGVMLHSQSPESMSLEQDFPISLEVQLLGGKGDGHARSTANLCTPGTHVMMADTLVTKHCISSASKTFEGDQWVRVEALVLGDSLIKHVVNGDTVLSYTRPHMGSGAANNTSPGVLREGKPMARGYIAIQAETAPIDFRKVELLNLEGCTDPEALTYKRYYVKADTTACFYAARQP